MTIGHTFICLLLDPNVAKWKSCSLLGSNNSRTQSYSCQGPFVATVGVYDGASGLSLVSVGSFTISDKAVLCRPLHRWHFPDNRQLRPTWPLCRQLKRLLVHRICLRVLLLVTEVQRTDGCAC